MVDDSEKQLSTASPLGRAAAINDKRHLMIGLQIGIGYEL
jgi:hypothetical protein